MSSNYHSRWLAANERRLAQRREMLANPSIDPETGERLRPMSQTEVHNRLVSNSWVTRW